VSPAGQVDGHGLDAQRRSVRTCARPTATGSPLAPTTRASWERSTRPGLSAALALIGAHRPVDGLLVARMDRLVRKLTTHEAVLAVVCRSGGEVVAADIGLT